MYNYLDYDHDRSRVRDKFLNEMNKRTTLADIGETLDKMHYSSKANNYKHYNLREHHNVQPDEAAKMHSSEDYKWSGRILKSHDPNTPLFIDDPNQINKMEEGKAAEMQDIYDRVKFNDSQRDHSYNSLTKDEKTEIALFHSMKQDPYYKHYLYNHLRTYAEEEDDTYLNMVNSSIEKMDIYDHPKFDRMNLYDFRRNVPMKERES